MCVLYFFIDFYFLQVLIFLERRRTVDLVFLIVRFVRVRNAGPYVCGLLNCTRRAMACNWSSAMGMNGGFIRGRIWHDSPLESLKSNVGDSMLQGNPATSNSAGIRSGFS